MRNRKFIKEISTGKYYISFSGYGISDLRCDLPFEANAALLKIPRVAEATFCIKNDYGDLLCFVPSKEGTDWYKYSDRDDSWIPLSMSEL